MTIIDVAKRANVSKSTASRVLTGDPRVSASAREAVLKAAEELNYVKDGVASSMRTGKSRSFLIIIPDIANSFWSEVVRGVQDVLDAEGYSLIIANSGWQKDRESRFVQLAREKKVDAILVNAPDLDLVKSFKGVACPVVVLGDNSNFSDFPVVATDSYQIVRSALDYVYSKGHRDIGIVISSVLDDEGTRNSRKYKAFSEFMKEKGLSEREDWIFHLPLSTDGGAMLHDSFSSLKEKPSVILTGNDLVAVGFIRKAHAMGVSIPADISLMGFDDIPLVEVMTPAVTTMAKPKRQIGESAGKCVLEMLKGNSVPKATLLKGSLVIRESVKDVTK